MYYDLLPKIKNAAASKMGQTLTSFSKMDFAVAKILLDAGYLKDVQKKTVGKKNFLEIKLSNKKINGFKLISKPSKHVYASREKIMPVKNNYGLGVFSTSKGIMSNKEARKNKVGGEYLFEIW